MQTPLVSIGIVLYNGEEYFPYFFSSLLSQTYQNFELLIQDQSPNGNAQKYIQKYLPEVQNDARVRIDTGENVWHSGGHNACISRMKGAYYLCASYDMWYSNNFLQNLVTEMEKPQNALFGSATGKLYQWNFEEEKCSKPSFFQKTPPLGRTNSIDSCGIGVSSFHHFFDIGQGTEDNGQYHLQEIFGASGALALYRKTALQKIIFRNGETEEYFDTLLHYKNDIDISYRLQWAKEKCLFIPSATVWHHRHIARQNGENGFLQKFFKNESLKPLWVKKSSFFGHLVLLFKNVWQRGFSFPTVFLGGVYVFISNIFLLCTAPSVLLEWKNIRKNWDILRKKRNAMVCIQTPEAIESFFV